MTFLDFIKIFFVVSIVGWLLDRRFRTIDISGARRPGRGRGKPREPHDDDLDIGDLNG